MLNQKLLFTSLFIFCIGVGIFFVFSKGYLWFVYPDKEKYPVMGIDVSHHQGYINWNLVKNDGVSFAYIKATEGDDWIDNRLDENFRGAKQEGIPLGFYHFYSLRIPAQAQLSHVIRTLSGRTFDLPIVVDLEFGGNSKFRPNVDVFQKDLQILLDGLEKFQGVKPILYITYEFKKAYLQNKFSSYPLWIRDIVSYPDNDSWIIWQYKNRGHIAGVQGFVDQNVLQGTIEDLIFKR